MSGGDQVVNLVRADTRRDAVFGPGLAHCGDQRLVSELLESVLRLPDRDDPPAALDGTGDVHVASLGETVWHDLRVDLVIQILVPALDFVYDHDCHAALLS